jgi:hypothetical protein
LQRLQRLEALDGGPITPQVRGLEFETWIRDALDAEQLAPRTRYRPKGEEIDGSFVLDGKTYLLEAKWHADALPASQIYAFKGKVDGKLVGTVGVVVSMSGFSEEAVEAVRIGKVLNVLLVDGDDVDLASQTGLEQMLRFKLREAAETGEIYRSFGLTAVSTASKPHREPVPEATRAEPGPGRRVALIVEGSRDETVVSVLLARVLKRTGREREVDIYISHGLHGIPRLVASLVQAYGADGVVVLVDADDDLPEAREQALRSDPSLFGLPIEVIAVSPQVDVAWVPEVAINPEVRRVPRRLWEATSTVDVKELQQRDPAFARLVQSVLRRLEGSP